MPLGFERINERVKRPNEFINFIKPLEGPDKALAQDFLQRVAAICQPIMKANHIAVMALEEYEANMEFVGRNFNAGEVIQLVLKAPFTGHWLPFRHVQMVMMHELAHCKQMNHSGAFWKVRNLYADELRGLWSKDYSGEGFWSRGKTLLSGQYTTDRLPEAALEPKSLCGGTYRSSRGRKRKRGRPETVKPTLSYAEGQQRRIAKKFGVNGVALGNDEETRMKLEDGKKPKGKPKVAGSARGRELRAAAALARFEKPKADVKTEQTSDSDTESEYEDGGDRTEATDSQGAKILDGRGLSMVKVCEDEDDHDGNAQRELAELHDVDHPDQRRLTSGTPGGERPRTLSQNALSAEDDNSRKSEAEGTSHTAQTQQSHPPQSNKQTTVPGNAATKASIAESAFSPPLAEPGNKVQSSLHCPICSMDNERGSLTCAACAHVLDTAQMPSHWRCQRPACRVSGYVNAGDCGVCCLCGDSKPVP
ncbi:Kelch repeat-containing protein 3 [Elasticomyces elasticus]|nr:Kelch repeat-containing protein 3 [Elasticomyces elasticus]